jgi:hypothetical protein
VPDPDADHCSPEAIRAEMDEPPALETLAETFALSPFERALVLLCAGVELDGRFAEAWGRPTLGVALASLPDPHWSALAPAAPLRRWRMLELGGGPLTSASLKLDERILHYLTGVQYLDERLDGIVGAPVEAAELPGSHELVAAAVVEAWSRDDMGSAAIALLGSDPAAKLAVAAAACHRFGIVLRVVEAAAIPAAPAEQEGLRRLWSREAMLEGAALFVDCEAADSEREQAAARFVEDLRVPVITAGATPLRGLRRPVVRLTLAKPTPSEQRALWERVAGPELNGTLDGLIAQFDLGTRAILAAQIQAAAGEGNAGVRLWEACRVQARPALDDLAERIEPVAGWDDLVLPDAQSELLHTIVAHVRHRGEVYDAWGFRDTGGRGLGISALFAGVSGTGKTMAAEVLARDLRLDLYRIDLSQVVSKYIGETEKNLRRVFAAAEESATILLFDEADALFGKRTEIRDSHDRYANIEVSYLLQRMEAYRGLAILTTNLRNALDQAFLRRLRFVVEFPFPGAAQRQEIWRRVFPARTPVGALDPERLAQLNVAGGTVRNIALNAAFLAAEARERVGMSHVLRAARSEYAKLEKPLTGAETGGWS